MKRIYPRLAVTSIKNNKRLYIPYSLTCSGIIMMFYIVSFLANGKALDSLAGASVMQQTLTFGCMVLGVFSLIFLFYTNSFLVKSRKKEFGLYNILGMGKLNLAIVLVWESLFISLISLSLGLFFGILFSKLAELLMINIMHLTTDFSFSVEFASVKQTVILFSVIFVLLLINTLRQIRFSEPIELLRSEHNGEKPPKANWLVALIGLALLSGAYAIALLIKNPLDVLVLFFVAVTMVIIATYLLFIAGSVSLCKILQKNKKYYYKTNHFVSISSMVFRMKRNGAGLASICILCTMVLVMLSSTVCLYIGAEDSLRSRNPRDIQVTVKADEYNEKAVNVYTDIAESSAKSYNQTPKNILSYQGLNFIGTIKENKISLYSGNYNYYDVNVIFIMSLDDYNKIMNANETLKKDEALIYCTQNHKYKNSDIILIDKQNTYKVKKVLKKFTDLGNDVTFSVSSMYIVIPDYDKKAVELQKLNNTEKEYSVECYNYYGYNLDCDDEQQIEIGNALKKSLKEQDFGEGVSASQSSIAMDRLDFYDLYGGLFFLGILLGIVFVFAAVLIIYYKQISEGYEDQSRFEIMQKVGMNKQEVKKSINSQVLTVFFLPLIASAFHLAFAFPMIYRMLMLFSITNIQLLIFVNLLCLAIFSLFYTLVYKITSKAYYSIVAKP